MKLLTEGEYGQKPGGPGLRSSWVLPGQRKDSADHPFVSMGLPGKVPQPVWLSRFESQATVQYSIPGYSDGTTKNNVFPTAFGVSFLKANTG